jgi:hypothetical protein
MPDADGEYCRMCDSLPWCIAANALEYTEVPLLALLPWVLLLMPRILRGSSYLEYSLTLMLQQMCQILQKQILLALQSLTSIENNTVPESLANKGLGFNTVCWNQQNRSPAYILPPSRMRFECVYRHWYGPAKPPVELCFWRHNTLQTP